MSKALGIRPLMTTGSFTDQRWKHWPLWNHALSVPTKQLGWSRAAFLHGLVAVSNGQQWEGIMFKNQEQETRQWEEEAEMWFEGWDIKVRPEDQNWIHWEDKFWEFVPKQGTETLVWLGVETGVMTEYGKLDWDLGLKSQIAEKQWLHLYLLALQHILGPSFPGHLNGSACWDTLQLPFSTHVQVSISAWSRGMTNHASRHGNWEALLGPTV